MNAKTTTKLKEALSTAEFRIVERSPVEERLLTLALSAEPHPYEVQIEIAQLEEQFPHFYEQLWKKQDYRSLLYLLKRSQRKITPTPLTYEGLVLLNQLHPTSYLSSEIDRFEINIVRELEYHPWFSWLTIEGEFLVGKHRFNFQTIKLWFSRSTKDIHDRFLQSDRLEMAFLIFYRYQPDCWLIWILCRLETLCRKEGARIGLHPYLVRSSLDCYKLIGSIREQLPDKTCNWPGIMKRVGVL